MGLPEGIAPETFVSRKGAKTQSPSGTLFVFSDFRLFVIKFAEDNPNH